MPEESQLMCIIPRSTRLLYATCFAVALCGCHQRALGRPALLDNELPAISSEELFQIALLQARRGDLLRAEQYLIAARTQGYDESTVAYWLVRVCVSAGRYHSALGHALGYLRIHPSDWRFRLIVASIHDALGDSARAQAELKTVVEAEPASPLPRYLLAMVYRQQPVTSGDAVPHLEAYLDLDPNGPHAEEARAILEERYGPPSETAPARLQSGKLDDAGELR